jgi:diaminopimelate epimerase
LSSLAVPAIVVSGYGHELGKIKWVYENTDIDRFIFLQDSVVIRDNDLLMSLFDTEGSSCIMCGPRCFGSYLGLYERKTLDQLDIPVVNGKLESVRYEIEWTQEYINKCEKFSHPINIEHQVIETIYKHGRENQVSVNKLYEKWKGTWSTDQIREE